MVYSVLLFEIVLFIVKLNIDILLFYKTTYQARKVVTNNRNRHLCT
jgi:hypothetical protein